MIPLDCQTLWTAPWCQSTCWELTFHYCVCSALELSKFTQDTVCMTVCEQYSQRLACKGMALFWFLSLCSLLCLFVCPSLTLTLCKPPLVVIPSTYRSSLGSDSPCCIPLWYSFLLYCIVKPMHVGGLGLPQTGGSLQYTVTCGMPNKKPFQRYVWLVGFHLVSCKPQGCHQVWEW